MRSFELVCPCSVGVSPISLVVVTAADRAAATLRRGGRTPPPAVGGHLPFRGGLAGNAPKGSLRRGSCQPLGRLRICSFAGERVATAGGYIFHHPLPRMVPLLLRKEARGDGRVATSYCFVSFGHDQRALQSPFGNLRPITPATMWCPALAGRGGSVSRRDHNQAAGNHTPTRSGILYGRKNNSNRSCSSGEGVWGRGASLREAASPQNLLPSHTPHTSICIS